MPKMKISLRARHAFIALMLVLFTSTANAQTKINGTVTDAESRPLKGATVTESGTKKGTVTDESGNFSISADKGASLVISMVGFEPVTVKVGDQSTISVQ